MLDSLYIRKVRQFYGLGIGFECDKMIINEKFGDVKTFTLGYSYKKGLEKIYEELSGAPVDTDANTRVMIGHSGTSLMNHIKTMEMMTRFVDYPIQIVLILSYGDEKYIGEVKSYAMKHFPKEKLEIIETFLPLEQYIKILNSVDIIVFDQQGSAALGNLIPLLYFEKKFVLNRHGIFKKLFDIKGIDYLTTDDLSTVSFQELKTKLPTQKKERKIVESRIRDDFVPNTWRSLLDSLPKKER